MTWTLDPTSLLGARSAECRGWRYSLWDALDCWTVTARAPNGGIWIIQSQEGADKPENPEAWAEYAIGTVGGPMEEP